MKRLLGVSVALCAASALCARRPASGGSWDERVFPSRLPSRFRCRSRRPAHRPCPPLSSGGASCSKPNSPLSTAPDGRRRPKPSSRPNARTASIPRSAAPAGRIRTPVSAATTIPFSAAPATTSPTPSSRKGSSSRSSIRPTRPSRASGTRSLSWAQGFIELLAREMTADSAGDPQARRSRRRCATNQHVRAELVTKGVQLRLARGPPRRHGRPRRHRGRRFRPHRETIQPQGRVHVARQFTINALNVHHGMEAVERFGVRWTGSHDFAESGVPDSMTAAMSPRLVAFSGDAAAADGQG